MPARKTRYASNQASADANLDSLGPSAAPVSLNCRMGACGGGGHDRTDGNVTLE